jgi:hypothetical protein
VDTPRRWQVASLATAVTSLGIGGLLLSRPSVEPLQPIVLDVRADAGVRDLTAPLDPIELEEEGRGPDVAEADVVTPQTPASLESVSSPAEPSSSTSSPAPSPAPTGTSSPAPTTSRSAPADPDESPGTADSVDSLDSDD